VSSVTEFDFVVVGGGSAGCAVAARLSEDPGVTVCLMEAGPSNVGDPAILRLTDWMALLDSGYDWDYPVEPQEKGNSFLRHARARVLGGCSSHNSCIAFWTPKEDLDEWAAMGLHGWSYEDVLPYFRLSEDNERGEDVHHGVGGPLAVSDNRSGQPLADAWVEAALQAGHERNNDFNGASQEGVGRYQVTQRGGLRCSAATEFLAPARARSNLSVITDAHATEILFSGRARPACGSCASARCARRLRAER